MEMYETEGCQTVAATRARFSLKLQVGTRKTDRMVMKKRCHPEIENSALGSQRRRSPASIRPAAALLNSCKHRISPIASYDDITLLSWGSVRASIFIIITPHTCKIGSL